MPSVRIASYCTAALILAACGAPSGPAGTGTVVLKLTSDRIPSGGAPLLSPSVSVSLGEDVLDITSVQLVARKLRLGRAAGSCPAEAAEGGATGETPASCALLRVGPLLLEPPLGPEAETTFEAELAAGTYDRIRLQIHAPQGSADVAFVAENPGFENVSIRVEGTFNGTPFVFTTSLTEEQEITLDEPLTVEEGGTATLTLLLDVERWFLDVGGASLIDPATTSQQLRSRIEQNIRQSFDAFEEE